MNIKGHAVVELRDVETGKIQRVEHDNMLTNGLKYCLTPWLGKFSYATEGATPQKTPDETEEIRKSDNRSMMNHLLGGIFLFQNNLEEDVDNTAFPLDNPLIGKASWDAYSGIDTYRGSYNVNESGLQDDGSYKHVWDFSTDQANGQIGALALTTYKGGICGDGFKDWNNTETTIKEAPFFELGQIGIDGKNRGAYCTPIIKAASNEIYYVPDKYRLSYDTAHADQFLGHGKLLFIKKKFPLSQLSPFYDYYNQYHTENIEIDVPEEFAAYIGNKDCRGKTSDNYLYIYKNTTISVQGTIKLMRIRKSDLETDIITLINDTPYILEGDNIQFTDDCCFLISYAGPPYYIYRINMADNEINEIINIKKRYKLQKIGDYIYAGSNTEDTYCINPKTMEVKHHPLFIFNDNTFWWDGSTEKVTPNIYLKFQHYYYSTNSDIDAIKVYISANTLMTINNLSSPVVKTAAQTMKVTYTIQEIDA